MQKEDVFNYEGIEIEYLKPTVYLRYIELFSKYDLFPQFRNNIAAAWAMWEQAKHGDGFDIVECCDFGLGFIPWVLESDRPVITRLHGSYGQIALHEDTSEHILTAHLFQSAESDLLPLADALISHSSNNAQFWNDLLNQEKVKVIYPVFHSDKPPLPLTERDSFGLVTARIQKWKGPEELCKATKLLPYSSPIKWFGRDMYFARNLSTAQYLSTAFTEVYNKRILFDKPLQQDAVHRLQRKCKFGLITSTWDMFNFTALEFMAAGTPLICSDGAGASELIEHGKNGYKYPANDIKALAQCIEKIDGLDEITYSQMANAGIETIKSMLNSGIIVRNNMELYRSILNKSKMPPENRYFNEAYRPSVNNYSIDRILDKQPLKVLRKYLVKRIKAKLLK